MPRRVLVTGAAGFIGSALANSLASKYDVTGIDNLTAGDWTRCRNEVKKIRMDLSTISSHELVDFLNGFEDVYHLAAVKLHNQENSLGQILANNVIASSKLFEASGIAGVKNVFFSSSLYSYGSFGPKPMSEGDVPIPNNDYGVSKLFGELSLEIAARKYGFRNLSARFFFIYGPRQYADGGYKSVIIKNFEKAIIGKPFEIYGDGEQALDYVYIDDCIEIIHKLMSTDFSGVVNLSSGSSVTIRTLIAEMQKITNATGIIFRNPDFTHGSVRFGSNEKLKSIIGEYSFTELTEGLQMTWESICKTAAVNG